MTSEINFLLSEVFVPPKGKQIKVFSINENTDMNEDITMSEDFTINGDITMNEVQTKSTNEVATFNCNLCQIKNLIEPIGVKYHAAGEEHEANRKKLPNRTNPYFFETPQEYFAQCNDILTQVGEVYVNFNKTLPDICDEQTKRDVFDGFHDGRVVAVKSIPKDTRDTNIDIEREKEAVRRNESNSNVVRIHRIETTSTNYYIAYEKCLISLGCLIESNNLNPKYDKIVLREIMRDAMIGLNQLHLKKFTHRNIRPNNILITEQNGIFVGKISNLASSKRFNAGCEVQSISGGFLPHEGWCAPELFNPGNNEGQQVSESVDIFSMGLVFYYTLTNGGHPFGNNMSELQNNIQRNRADFQPLLNRKNDKRENKLAISMIKCMVKHKSAQRPTAHHVLKHPFFWSEEKILKFFNSVNSKLQGKNNDTLIVIPKLESKNATIFESEWNKKLDLEIIENFESFAKKNKSAKYDYKSTSHLIKAMRNSDAHRKDERNAHLQRIYDSNGGFCNYWLSRFPNLLHQTYWALQNISHLIDKDEVEDNNKFYCDGYNFNN